MMAFGISSLVFSVIALFIPFLGVIISGLSGILAWFSIGRGTFVGGAAVIINFINIILMSPGYILVAGVEASQRAPDQSKMFIVWAIVLCVQLVAVFLFIIGYLAPLFRKLKTQRAKATRLPISNLVPENKVSPKIQFHHKDNERNGDDIVSPLTKILVSKVHGKRKMDSKFWNSSFSTDELHEINIDNSGYHRVSLRRRREYHKAMYMFLFLVGAGAILVLLRPDLVAFLKYSNGNTVISKYFPSENNLFVRKPEQSPQYSTTQIEERNYQPKTQNHFQKDFTRRSIQNEGKIYSWKDSEGDLHLSNVNFPIDNDTLKVQTEINTYRKATPINVVGNSVYIPVTLYNKGKTIKTSLLLDTGCTTTVIQPHLLRQLHADYIQKTSSTVADGRKVAGKLMEIDYIRVGPFSEKDFKIIGLNNTKDKDAGLLGMNFLKNHPFELDLNKRLIIWQ